MPTCSQAKIITNLESDIHKKLFKISQSSEPNLTEYSKDDIGTSTVLNPIQKNNQGNLFPRSNSLRKFRTINDFKMMREHQNMINSQIFTNSVLNYQSRGRNYIDLNLELKKLTFVDRRESVPVNFMYNSHYRGRNPLAINQMKNNFVKQKLNEQIISDDEETDSPPSSNRSGNSEQSSTASIDCNYMANTQNKRPSADMHEIVDPRQNNTNEDVAFLKRRDSETRSICLKGQLSYFPKLALEFDSLRSEKENQISLSQAKRLLTLASIRPSKTFHKSMSEKEIEILKKYYDSTKPRVSINNQFNQNDTNNLKLVNSSPLVYNTAKVNSSSLESVRSFLSTYQKDLESGLYKLDYDGINDPKCFVLKNKLDESVLKFPEELNDTFFALAATTTDRDRQNLSEANLFRIVNWNEASVTSIDPVNRKITRSSFGHQNIVDSVKESPTSSTISFEGIKNLTNLVSNVIEPKLLNNLTISGVDVGVLPGGVNFEMPTFEEMGINLETLLKSNTSGQLPPIHGAVKSEIQSAKLKNSAYKKLKDKVSKSKVMWFASPPDRKPFSVIFEYAGVDMNHATLLDEANQYLKEVGGHIISLEFVPRSVLLNSVYVENLWILNLNDNSTKFYLITNGLKIKDEIIRCKSYDEFIFAEYENFIRNEKYKQLIKNHEKAIEKTNRRLFKK